MPLASEKYVKKKLHDTFVNLSSDEEIVYQLRKHVDSFTLKHLAPKIYFNETDLSMDSETKIWINLLLSDFFPNYHCHDCYEFNIVFQGKCIEIINDIVVTLEKGDILIIPENSVSHTHYLKSGGRGCNILVKSSHLASIRNGIYQIKDNFLDRLIKKQGFCIIHTSKHPDIINDIDELLEIYMEENKTKATSVPPTSLSRMYTENTFHRMILKICKGIEIGSIVCDFSATTNETFSPEEIITYIKDNHTKVSTEEISKKFGYSQRQLNRIIKKYTGSGFSTLVTYERIIHTKNLLKNTSLSIAEISKAAGLDSKAYFCNMFKKQTGMTPNEYRKMARNTGSKN